MEIGLFAIIIAQCCYICRASVHIERIGPTSVSKNCDNKPCFQGKCENDKCRCFAGWGGQQCDRCYGRTVLNDETEVITDGPRNYSSSSRCMWIIKGEEGSGPLLLKLDSFITECSWDHVYVYDGNGVHGEQLAAFSGTVSGVELSVRSGKALVYFFSDLAFNMYGFNITFAYEKCLSSCSSHGRCVHGVCQCFSGYTGAACERRVCTKDEIDQQNAKACNSSGSCNANLTCTCNRLFHGDSCQRPTTHFVFDSVITNGEPVAARASHASVLVGETQIWTIGGAHFSGVNFSTVAVFDILTSTWENKKTVRSPPSRYDHSLVQYKNKLYMFGGVIHKKDVTNELWSLDILTLEWKLEDPGSASPDAIPSAVAGHTAHIIGDEMFVFYGYNPYQGYIYKIQKYKIGSGSWENVIDSGPDVHGRFGHSLVAYTQEKKHVILIYGGFMPPNDGSYSTITNSLIEYRCDNQGCSHRTLSSGPTPVFRHSASLINGMMIVIGGNGHNESTSTRTQDCYSGKVQEYNVECDVWFTLDAEDAFLQRYGHSSVASKSNIFAIGGFNGTMLNDVIKFTPGVCGDISRPDLCLSMHEGQRCIYQNKKCKPVLPNMSYAQSFISFIKNEDPKEEQKCPDRYSRRLSTWCSSEKSCSSCTGVDGCSWCAMSRECIVSESSCRDESVAIDREDRCPKDSDPRPCSFAHDCFSCKMLPHCSWSVVKESKWKCISSQEVPLEEEQHQQAERSTTPSRALIAFSASGKNVTCPSPCSALDVCDACIKEQCMWCPTTHRCVPMDAYMISFPYGQCQSWITVANTLSNQHACQLDPSDCSKQKTCAECQRVGPKCGWCDDGSGTGLGRCLSGSLSGPLNATLCPSDGRSEWYFTNCSACQCNGHSNCTTKKTMHEWIADQSCTLCGHNTTGEHCQHCAEGFYGDPRNGGRCEECRCNGQATMCHRETGDCFCTTKGVTGKTCNKCEQKYYGDPENNQPCYYELTVDFIFTFKLDQDDPKDKYVNQINFFSTPHKRDTDVQFTVVCESTKSEKAYVSMQINSSLIDGRLGQSKPLMARTLCDENGIRRTYSANSEPGFIFGTDANTTFLVTVHNFSTPIKIQISFSQSPPINWVLFFIIFAACFVVLLVVAGLLWMIKLRIEVFRRNQRRYDEIEQMASRPFASVRLELASPRANLMATPISVEPCSNYRAGVFTLAVRLPTGGRQFTPHGTSGLAVASALCLLTPAQLGVLQAPESSDAQQNRKTTLMRYIPFIRS